MTAAAPAPDGRARATCPGRPLGGPWGDPLDARTHVTYDNVI